MSSRNENLTPQEREKASIVFKALGEAKSDVKNGERNTAALTEIVVKTIAPNRLRVSITSL
jgi:pantothenate synthetase